MSGEPSAERIAEIRRMGRLTYTETIILAAYDDATARAERAEALAARLRGELEIARDTTDRGELFDRWKRLLREGE